MGSVALHGLDKVRDEIVALLELDVDVREGLAVALSHRHQAVVSGNEPNASHSDKTKKNQEHRSLLKNRPAPVVSKRTGNGRIRRFGVEGKAAPPAAI